jgi:hypothetical protein
MNREKEIASFWEWFRENQEYYSNFNDAFQNRPEEATELLDEITMQLKLFSKGLFVEISATLARKELIITAQGNKEYFTDAFELVNMAPTVEDWQFIATKPAIGLDFNFKMGDVTINPNEITFMPLEASEYPHDVAIRLFHKDYTPKEGATRNAVIVGLYSALNMLLGEVRATLDFQYIDFDDMPHPKERDFPFAGLKDYIEYKKSQRPNSGIKFPKEDIGLLEGRIEELPTLLILNRALSFYEFTQEFPFLLQMTLTLHNTNDKGLPQGNTDELYIIEDIIYQEIYKKERGHFIATETYNSKRELFYYADTKETIEEALSLLPTEYTICDVHYSVDYDPFWIRVDRYREL